VNYAEKYGLDDADDVAAARRRVAAGTQSRKKVLQMSDGDHSRRRFSVGARVYDSELGATCHWCRQKTVEAHVVCTNALCGKPKRAPVRFCGMCLRNRHGEDIERAVASGMWECPRCRGSCGEGCAACCNCGPCRKANGLPPTHQVVQLARAAGFDNVHDYLVHGVTGESPEELLERKKTFNWGKWLMRDFKPAADESAAAPAAAPAAATAATATPPRIVDFAGALVNRRGDSARDSPEAATARAKRPETSVLRKRPWERALEANRHWSAGKRASDRPVPPETPDGDARTKRDARVLRGDARTRSRELFGTPSPETAPKRGGLRGVAERDARERRRQL
jgi:hypothetical protein